MTSSGLVGWDFVTTARGVQALNLPTGGRGFLLSHKTALMPIRGFPQFSD